MQTINKAYMATVTGLQYRYVPLSRFSGEYREHERRASVIERVAFYASVHSSYDVAGCNESVTQDTLQADPAGWGPRG